MTKKIIEKLEDIKLIDKDEKAGETAKFFLDAAKSARDAITHKITFFPSPSEAFSLLSYAFRMSDFLIKYENYKKGVKQTDN